ncbi:MAG: metal ABC transporter solute-binding protein, Zn/Mn family [Dysgonomonas sp.]
MKFKSIYIYFIFIVLFFSCKEKKNAEQINNTLSVSIDPQRYFVEKITGDKFTVNCLIPAGSNPETYDPTPSQMVSLSKSKAYFKVGLLGFENVWLKKIQDNNPDMLVVDCSADIPVIEDSGHGHDGFDPHVWSSPKTASVMAKSIYEEVIKLDADNKDFYKRNYEELLSEFVKTDSIIKSYVDSMPNRSFIIFHPALSYFADEYGLEQLSIEHEGKSPSPSQLKELIDEGKAKQVKVVFIQQEYDKKNAEIVAKEIGAKTVSINLLSYDWSGELIKIARSLAEIDE